MKARISRDHSDRVKIYDMLKSCSPFSDNPALRNIINGITADKKVNVDKFIEIGQEIIDKMAGNDVFTFKCSHKSRAHNMTTKITLDKDRSIKCDPGLLFQRLLLAAHSNLVDMDEF